MSRQFKLVVFFNGVFVLLFIFFDWLGYEMLSLGSSGVRIQTHFPFYISGQTIPASSLVSGFQGIILPNYLLLIFLIATITNLFPL